MSLTLGQTLHFDKVVASRWAEKNKQRHLHAPDLGFGLQYSLEKFT